MIRLIFQMDKQTGEQTWGTFHKTIDIDIPEVKQILKDGWTFIGLEEFNDNKTHP